MGLMIIILILNGEKVSENFFLWTVIDDAVIETVVK